MDQLEDKEEKKGKPYNLILLRMSETSLKLLKENILSLMCRHHKGTEFQTICLNIIGLPGCHSESHNEPSVYQMVNTEGLEDDSVLAGTCRASSN